MNRMHRAAAAALFAAGAAGAQSLDDSAAPAARDAATSRLVADRPASVLLPQPAAALSSTPAVPAPFRHIGPAPRTYLRNEADTDRMPRNPSAFGRWLTDPRLLAGVELAPWLAVEGGYVELHDRGTRFVDFARGDEAAGALGLKGSQTHAAVKLTAPVGQRLEAYGKAGIAYSEYKHGNGEGRAVTDVDAGPYVGIGARYRLNGKASVTAGYEQYGDSERKWGGASNNNGLKAKLNLGF
jgi:hypothetical protein